MWVWRRMESVKWTDKIKNAVVLERVGEGRVMLELIRKRSIFCGPLEKELRKRLVKCFMWSVALYGAETWTL